MDKTDEPMKRMANLRLSQAGFASYYKHLLTRNHLLFKGNRKNTPHQQRIHSVNSYQIH
ncbi:hypothetical protein [Oceanobacillus sp. CFH 90083]|uniref:hypothetical protein n=1 Tax=Oceanobacillus sp. CFH 90083 TaxID=2592336 RepID=UPI0018838D9E|nr:hypothetical protein [Oceanobacillus sp. CFH 90083]